MKGPVGETLVGTAGWSDRSLVAAGWYPRGVSTPEQRLRHYATRFSFVEVNSTFYGLPEERTTQAWADRTPDTFTFNVKAHGLFTLHSTKAVMLPPDVRPADKNRVQKWDLSDDVVDDLWDRFVHALKPIQDKLGLLLFQFPPWFRPAPQSREYILECQERAAPFRICVEFRHPAWLEDDATLPFLTDNDIPYVCVDMPQGTPESVPPVLATTAPEAVVRLHGQSPQWIDGTKEEKYHYRYSEIELHRWARRIRQLASTTDRTYVVLNNCYRDDAQNNAAELRRLLQR